MQSEPGEEEQSRAKIELHSMLLINLEYRPVVFEDDGRQVLATEHQKQPEDFITKIEKVSARAAQRIFATPPSMATREDIQITRNQKE